MQIYKSKWMCTGCTACSSICSKNAITMQADDEGFLYPHIAEELCIECGMCMKVCHTHDEEKINNMEYAFCFINEDSKVLENSSSGGAFSYISQVIREKNGWVSGAVFDKLLNVRHIVSRKQNDIEQMRGSKYVQSKLETTFCDIKKLLDSGEQILFTGTPCQVIGLKNFLRKDYINLTCVDFVCSSIPSPLIYSKYLEMKEQEIGKIESISFRDKKEGWEQYGVKFYTQDGEVYEPHKQNLYLSGFMGALYSRECCEECPAKERIGYMSDITLGDLWGADVLIPESDYKKGASLVIVHSEKGMEIMRDAKKVSIDMNQVVEYNPRYRNSHCANRDRDIFWSIVRKKGLKKAYRYIYHPGFLRKIQLKVRKKT